VLQVAYQMTQRDTSPRMILVNHSIKSIARASWHDLLITRFTKIVQGIISLNHMKQGIIWIIILIIILVIVGVVVSSNNNEPSANEEVVMTATTTEVRLTENQPSLSSVARDTTGTTVVTYSDKGFSPFIVEIEAGESIKFVNESNDALWLTANGHPTAADQFYPEFDSGKSLKRDESYSFVFNNKGVWGYKNLNNEEHLGTIVVTPQR